MKTLILTLATAALTGCAVYPAAPAYGPYGAAPLVYSPPPVYLYGAGGYRYGGYPSPYAYSHAYPRGYYGVPPGIYGPRPGFGGHYGAHNHSGHHWKHQGRR